MFKKKWKHHAKGIRKSLIFVFSWIYANIITKEFKVGANIIVKKTINATKRNFVLKNRNCTNQSSF